MTTLTNAAVRAMAPGATLWDDVVKGLHVRYVGKRHAFYLYFRTKAGIERRPKLEDWGAITLTQARDAAREMWAVIAAGRDPVAERQAVRGNPTVKEFFDTVYADHWSKRKTATEYRRNYERYVDGKLGSVKMVHLDHSHVEPLHTALTKDSGPYMANRVIELVTTLCNKAETAKYKVRPPHSNPCSGIVKNREHKRRRKAEPNEILRIGPILEREALNPRNTRSIAYLYALAYSGARPSEVVATTPEHITEVLHPHPVTGVLQKFGIVNLSDGKTDVPIVNIWPPHLMAMVDKLPKVAGEPLFGITTNRGPKKLWTRIRKEAGCPDLRMRDWRRTFASLALSKVRATPGQIGELLNHASTQTTKIYTELYIDTAKDVTAETAAVLERMMRPTPSTSALPAASR